MDSFICGLDLGGSKIEGVLLDRGTNQVLARYRTSTLASEGYDVVLSQVKTVVAELENVAGSSIEFFGLAMPGILDTETGLVKNCNATCLNGKPIVRDLQKETGKKVVVANDANCFTLAETLHGNPSNLQPKPRLVFGIILGTGVGGGLVFDGKIWEGKHGIAGEWGHMIYNESGGIRCYCGKIGCNETVFSGPALEKYYQKLSGKASNLQSIYQSRYQDDCANATIQYFLKTLGRAVAQVINVLDPCVIVFGGGLSKMDIIYEELKYHILPYLFNRDLKTPLLAPDLGDSAGVFGAADLVRYMD